MLAGLEADLVSYTEESSLIHTTIVQNLYDNPIVICDVSGKNPNVMFELGLRLAFDKPTIIIKDDKTGYSFDTGSIEHLTYPRDLRFGKIVEFKTVLAEKIKATLAKSTSDPNYSTFLKHFKRVTFAKLEDKEVSGQEYILEELKGMRQQIDRLTRPSNSSFLRRQREGFTQAHAIGFSIKELEESDRQKLLDEISKIPYIKKIKVSLDEGKDHMVEIEFVDSTPSDVAEQIMRLRDSLAPS